jgi:hypothetical protein
VLSRNFRRVYVILSPLAHKWLLRARQEIGLSTPDSIATKGAARPGLYLGLAARSIQS